MKLEIDQASGFVSLKTVDGTTLEKHSLGSREGFKLVSQAWLRAGWDAKHVYTFTWLGRPIIQLPEDIIRLQETIYSLRPDVIVETGIAHGGSAVFFASLCKLMGKGRVIAVDIDIREHNREAIERHNLSEYITLIEGDSIKPSTVNAVHDAVGQANTVLVFLDSNHSKNHVLAELEAYSPLVTLGSYCIVCDGIMKDVVGAPRTNPGWQQDNPVSAVKAFLEKYSEFTLDPPEFMFNESSLSESVSYWPSSHLRRVK